MFICSDLVIYLLILIKLIDSNPFHWNNHQSFCPLIELVSFGSDFQIKCNDTYLTVHETNSNGLSWKFANQSVPCRQNGVQKAPLHRCNVTRIDSKYLTVPLKSIRHEIACVYCRLNYRPISPTILVTQTTRDDRILYKFNISTSRLTSHQSFEILWSKRVSQEYEDSIDYWFSANCLHPHVESIETTNHQIVFTVEEMPISRVEFLIRYCRNSCRTYEHCHDATISEEVMPSRYLAPDSVEKISCDENCLNGLIEDDEISPISTTISSEIEAQPSNPSVNYIRRAILYFLPGSLILILLILLTAFLISRMRGIRKRHIYIKTTQQTSNEGTSTME